jgi:hypothetical protein
VVSRKDNDGVLVQLAVLEEPNELANLVVDEAASSEVGAAGTDLGLIWNES